MFPRAALASLMLVSALTSAAQAQVNLHWKLKEGDTFFVEEKIVGKTTVTAMGKPTIEEQIQHRLSHFVVTSRVRDEIILEQRIQSWVSKIVGGLAGDQDDTQLMEELTKGVVFTIHMSLSGAITRFEGYDKFLQRLTKKDPAEAKKFKAGAAGEDILRVPLMQIFDIMPPAGAKAGQPWTKHNAVSLGPMGTFNLATTFTHVGREDGAEKIDTKATFSFEPGTANAGELGFKIIKLDLTKNTAAGRVVFDNAKGRMIVREMTLPLAGTMVIEQMGKHVAVQLDGTETRTVRMMDKRPK